MSPASPAFHAVESLRLSKYFADIEIVKLGANKTPNR